MERKQLIKKLSETTEGRREILLLIQDCSNMQKRFDSHMSFKATEKLAETGKSTNAVYEVFDSEYYKNKIKSLQNRLKQYEADFEKLISCLDGKERSILILRHLQGRSWKKTAQEICYSRSQAIRIYNKALEKLMDRICNNLDNENM